MKKHPKNEWANERNKPSFGPSPAKSKIEAAGHEMKVNPPAILAQTRKKKGKKAAQKQKIAIMLSKARRGS